ncbi:ABC transporter ATP-binding protein [Clostridium sporogenes]|uniref:ABC transporter ATP-binding protein n=1 Tax=Clostridium sp. LCP25S3_F8 TaxID=3438751 RepID=UPI0013CFDC96|nr:ABC transporter ATP-binding protein [Clostridium sporogenes]NFS25364.1 ABC transporter ATP-binding protein [Clostridium sporogenes]
MLKVNDVTFNYVGKESRGIFDVNLDVNKGECILLCGKSGCGKTTITRLINKLVPYFYEGNLKGNLTIDDHKIEKLDMYEVSEKVGSVFQNPRSQFFNVDTDSEISFGMENLSYPREVIKERLKKTTKDLNIENLLNRDIFKLSGGEKQKIAFASIYAMSPEVFVLDEPSSNLDAKAIEELRRNISLLKKQGKTIVISEHRLYYLKDLVDKVVYMDKGYIKNIYSREKFNELSIEERYKMGLRAIDLSKVKMSIKESKFKSEDVLEIKNVSLRYNKNNVLQNVSFKVKRGEVIGIIGGNGAGKSTFSRTLCGLNKKYDGDFYFNGHKVDNKSRLKLSYMVMQDVNYQLFAESVLNECKFGIKDADEELVETTLKELGLYGYRNVHPNTLSGGQKQRLAVAVSIVCKKEILIFDEPTSGLDYNSMVQVSRLINKLSDMGKIVFIVTHDYEFVSQVCNRVIHFHNHKVLKDVKVNEKNREFLEKFFIVS